MTTLDWLLLLMLASVPAAALLAPIKAGRWLLLLSYLLQMALLAGLRTDFPVPSSISFNQPRFF